jgi:hypothetical protein
MASRPTISPVAGNPEAVPAVVHIETGSGEDREGLKLGILIVGNRGKMIAGNPTGERKLSKTLTYCGPVNKEHHRKPRSHSLEGSPNLTN